MSDGTRRKISLPIGSLSRKPHRKKGWTVEYTLMLVIPEHHLPHIIFEKARWPFGFSFGVNDKPENFRIEKMFLRSSHSRLLVSHIMVVHMSILPNTVRNNKGRYGPRTLCTTTINLGKLMMRLLFTHELLYSGEYWLTTPFHRERMIL